MKQSTKKYWQRNGSHFAQLYSNLPKFSFKKLVTYFLDTRTRILNKLVDCRPQDTILDLGCGSGVHLKLFAPQCKKIVGVDVSRAMLSLAEQELKSFSRKNWQLKLADAQDLPFKDKSFNGIISMGLLDYVPSPAKVLQECYRVLKPSGWLVVSLPKKPSLFAFLRTPIGNYLKKIIFDLPPVGNISDQSELEKLLENTGFQLQKVHSPWTTMWLIKAKKKI